MQARRFVVLASLSLAAIAGCGSDSTSPDTIDISGQWAYSASNLAGGGVSCNISGVTLILSQSGSTFSGTTSGGSLSCTGAGGTVTTPLGTGSVASGQVNGSAVQFDFSTQDFHNAGSLSGSSMSGIVTAHVVSGTATTNLSGSFAAVKR